MPSIISTNNDSARPATYEEVKQAIALKRKEFAEQFHSPGQHQSEITAFWVSAIGNDLFSNWQNTPWDFNGTTTQPQEGTIACGYFVTTLLQAMGVRLNRIQLSTCASSVMMKKLVPGQRLRNLSYLDYHAFNTALSDWGKGVYVIGLDFHTGFIVNDGTENWFIHSNYIGRKGVTKETVLNSTALQSSKTRWMVSLTGDSSFLQKWLKL